jgi:hypothetical protein
VLEHRFPEGVKTIRAAVGARHSEADQRRRGQLVALEAGRAASAKVECRALPPSAPFYRAER